MSYRFKLHQSVKANLRRIAGEQVDRALADLDNRDNLHEGVHQARKRWKKIRALLRLLQKPLGNTYRRENKTFRNLGRSLSGLRDAEALVETVDLLSQSPRCKAESRTLRLLRERLLDRREQLTGNAQALSEQVSRAQSVLSLARRRIDDWPMAEKGFDALGSGFTNSYRRGRKAIQQAYDAPTVEAFHELRKRVKDHWYHVRLLQQVWPEMMQTRQQSLKQLADLLGNEHNLAVLRQTLDDERDRFMPHVDLPVVQALIAGLRTELQTQARPLAELLFAEKPRALTKRVGRYWQIAANEAVARRRRGTPDGTPTVVQIIS